MGKHQEIPENAINLSTAVMARAAVVRATEFRPTSGVAIADATGLTQSAVSRLLAGMRDDGDARYGQTYLTDPDTGRAVAPIIGTEQLLERVAEDPQILRAAKLLEFAEQRGMTPGAAFDELLRLGATVLNVPPDVAQRLQPETS